MRKGDINRFFLELSKQVFVPLKIYLTGGTASWFWGGERPTEDIDFGLKAPKNKWNEVEDSIQQVSRRLKIPVQFTEEIDRWGMIGIRDYKKGARLYRKFGSIWVYLLDVAVWSVGKLARYYQSDVDDLKAVFKKQKPDPKKLIRVWGQALQESPRSSSQILFVKTVEDFIKHYGREIWGKTFSPDRYTQKFSKHIQKR